jgi:predicted GNAT superfamily acetyltransferase
VDVDMLSAYSLILMDTTSADNATAEIFVANAESVYTSTVVLTQGIKLDGTSFYFSSFSERMNHTYYLDNIVYTRKAREETPAE